MKNIEINRKSIFSDSEVRPVNDLWQSFLKLEDSIANCRSKLQHSYFACLSQAGKLPIFSDATFAHISEMKSKVQQINFQLNLLEETLKHLQKISAERFCIEEEQLSNREYIDYLGDFFDYTE